LSPRFVLVHIAYLPIESAFVAERRGGQEYRGWGPDRYMAAGQMDLTKAQSYLFLLANSDPKKARPKPPEPYPVPGGHKRVASSDLKPGSFAFIAAAQLAAAKRKAGQ